jgi:hypothetical protein
MAYEQYNIIMNAGMSFFTTPVPGSSAIFFLSQEMHIQTGTASSCYLSQATNSPFISVSFKGSIDFTTIDLIGMIE